MTEWRVAWRLCAILALTLGSFLAMVATLPLRVAAPSLQVRIRNRIFRFWSLGFSRIVGMRILVEGEPPSGGFFLVSNHLGYMDILLLGSQIHAAFVAKADLRQWPVLGVIFASADTIFIDRGRKRDLLRVLQRIETALERELGILLFPEGTSGRGDELLPFKPSLLQLPAGRGDPVHWATLSYRTGSPGSPAQETVCWWGDTAFVPHILRLLRLPAFEARIRFGGEPIACADRKELARRLNEAMRDGFEPSD